MKTILERHRLAPELTTLIHRGVRFSCPGATSIRQARHILGWRPVEPGIVATVAFTRAAPWDKLDATYEGRVTHRREALRFARARAACHAGGPLLSGETLQDAVCSIKTRMVG